MSRNLRNIPYKDSLKNVLVHKPCTHSEVNLTAANYVIQKSILLHRLQINIGDRKK